MCFLTNGWLISLSNSFEYWLSLCCTRFKSSMSILLILSGLSSGMWVVYGIFLQHPKGIFTRWLLYEKLWLLSVCSYRTEFCWMLLVKRFVFGILSGLVWVRRLWWSRCLCWFPDVSLGVQQECLVWLRIVCEAKQTESLSIWKVEANFLRKD